MDKARLEWVMSGLNQYALTKTEDQFLKAVSADFDKNHGLTEHQEERLENLYKDKSRLKPNKNAPGYFSFKKSNPQKAKVRKPHVKLVNYT